MKPLTNDAINAALATRLFGRTLVLLPVTGSTNDVAKKLAASGAPEGTVVVTEEQTAGRGRMGRPWLAPPGTCLLCSIIFRPDLTLSQAGQLAMLSALAAVDAIEESTGLATQLKWPNDLIVASTASGPDSPAWGKIAGLLTETEAEGERLEYGVVGLGINVNVETEALTALAPDATSILAETGQSSDRAVLLARLLAGIERRYEALKAGEGPYAEWASRLATVGRPVDAVTAAGTLSGVAEAVDENGALLLRTPDGTLHRLLAGDVTLGTLRGS